MSKKKKIAVVGAGIAGLTCAYELKRAGFDVTVYEKRDQVGGRMATRLRQGFMFDIGADHLCNLYAHIKRHCDEFKIEWEKVRFLKYGLYRDGKVRSMLKSISWWSRIRLALQYSINRRVADFFDLKDAVKYDKGNAYDYMAKHAGREVADYLADSFTSTYQFHRAKEISAGALIAVMDSIQKDKEGWYLHRTKGGMSALPEAFAKELDVQLGVDVKSVEPANRQVKVVAEEAEIYDAVVLASTADISKKIYKNPSSPQKKILNSTRYACTVSVVFRVPLEKLPDFAVVWVPYVQSKAISGYVNEAMKGEQYEDGNEVLLCAWLHEDFAKGILNLNDEEIYERVRAELLKVCPWIKDGDLTPHDLERWPSAMPKFEEGHLTRVSEFLKNGQGDQNVFLCGDFLNSPWTEGALRCGERVAEQVTQQLRA